MKRFLKHWIGARKDWFPNRGGLLDSLVSLTPSQLKTHALLIGATGSGKSNAIHHMIAQDILLGHSFIVLDMRGDLISTVLQLCEGHVPPEKVKLFDLREKVRPFGFNPLFGKGEAYFRALNVLDVVANEAESWGVQLADSMRNGVLLLAETQSPLTKLEALFYDPNFRADLVSKSSSESIRAFWQRYDTLSPDKQNTLAMPVMNKVSLLLSTQALRRTLGHQAPVDIGAHLNTPGSITLISLAVDELHAAGRMMGNMMLSTITREIFSRVDIPESKRNPVRLYVDEFENFAMSEFENILAEGRRFKLHLVLAHQTLAQLTPKIRSMILNNVGAKLVFRTGREDGAILSKDLTGDPKAFNLPDFPTGDCVLWTRDHAPIHIEINAPIVKNSDSMNPKLKAYIEAIRSFAPEFVEQREVIADDEKPHVENTTIGSKRRRTSGKNVIDLEDWL